MRHFALAIILALGLAVITLSSLCAARKTVYPVETDVPLHNPLMGWGIVEYIDKPDMGTFFSWEEGEVPYPWYDNIQLLFTWAMIEKNPGEYDWSEVDRVMDYWISKGKTIHIIAPTEFNWPSPAHAGVPAWLYEMGVPKWTPSGGLEYEAYPDYTHPLYKERLAKYLREFADRFCSNPHVESIALRGFGTWGEWHSGYRYRSVEERQRAIRGIFDIWREAVAGRKLLSISLSYEWVFPHLQGNAGMLPRGTSIYDEYRPTYRDFIERSLFDRMLDYPMISWRRDGVGGAVFQEYDGRLIANLFEHWRKPMFAEPFGGYEAFTGPSIVGFPDTKEGDNHLENAIDEALTHRANYLTMHWGKDFHAKHPELVAKAQKLMGYRFVLVRARYPEAVSPGGELTIEQVWENRGMGRCYRRFPLTAYLMQDGRVIWSAEDIELDQTYMVAGQGYHVTSCFRLPDDLRPGEYELRLAMVDDSGSPTINLAMEGGDREKRYLIGRISVQQKASEAVKRAALILKRMENGCAFDGELLPNETYLVSFRYHVDRNPSNDLNTDNPGYFAFYAEGEDGVRIGETRWFDKAGQPSARRTLLVALRERTDYRLVWESIGGGSMLVDDVTIELLSDDHVLRIASEPDIRKSASEDLLLYGNAQAFSGRRPPSPLPIIVAGRDRSEVTLPDDYYDFLSTNPESVRLKPNTRYTVWFNSSARPQVWQGDYHYLSIRSDRLGREEERGFFMWTQRHTSNPVRRAYSFTTGDSDDYRLVWGIKNGGYSEISQIVITEL